MDKLIDLKWNFAAQNSTIGFNSIGLDIADASLSDLLIVCFMMSKMEI